ncbi:MAG: hypothetical protein ACLRZ9_12970 [Eubacterium sp.]
MQSLNFEEGYKEFAINGDESRILRFNPGDWGMMERIDKVTEVLEGTEKELAKSSFEEISKIVVRVDKKIKEQFNYLINSPNASDVIFGGQSPLNPVGNSYLFVKVLEALIPIIKNEVEAEVKKSKKRIEKYTEQYKK